MKSAEFYEIVNGLVLAANLLAEGNQDPNIEKYKDKVTQLANFVNEKRKGDAGFQVADLKQLIAYLGETHIALNALKDKGVSETMMKNTADQLKLLEQTAALMDVTMNLPLTQVVDETSISNYELQGGANKAGANSSSRSMIVARDVNKENVDGFFTPEEKVFDDEVNKRISLIANEMLRKYRDNEELRDFIEKLNRSTYGHYTLISCMAAEIENAYSKDESPKNIDIGHAYKTDRLVSRGIIDEEDIRNNKGLKEFLIRVRREFTLDEINKYATQHVQYGPLKGRGILAGVGSSVSGRNVAMSNVANILGVPNLVAKSVPATVKEDGKEVKGVFMKKAVGLDFIKDKKELKKTDFMLLTGKGFSGEGLKQLADLQVLDYLCQYVDRHQNNLLYTIKDGNIDGIQAIDNDISFGTLVLDHDDTVQNGSTLHDISVISESMKRSIMNLQPETFEAAISDLGLTDAEIRAAKKRLDNLKEYITQKENTKDKLEARTVKVIKDEEWKDMDIEDLSKTKLIRKQYDGTNVGSNIFSRTINVFKFSRAVRRHYYGKDKDNEEAAIKEYLDEKERIQSSKGNEKSKYTGTVLLDEFSLEELNNKRNSFEKYRKDMSKFENSRMRQNPAYTEMKNALNDVLEFKHEKEMDYEERARYDSALIKLRDAANAYVNDCVKNGAPKKGDKSQLENAKKLGEFTDQHESIFHQALLDSQEAEQNEVYNELQKEQKQFDRIVDVLSEKISEQMQGVDKAKVADRIKSGPVLRAMLNERVAGNDGKLRDNYKHYADMAAAKPKELVDVFMGKVRQNAVDTERKQSINFKTVNKFEKHLQNLKNAKTDRNSKEYEALIRAVDIMNKTEKLNVGVELNEKQLYAVKLLGIKSSINDYIAHKAKNGVNKNVGDKLAVVEKLNKEVSQILDDIRDEVEPFTLNGKKVDLSKLPITKAEEIEKARKANPNGQIPEEHEMQNSTDDCMQRIITKAIQRKYSASHIKDLNKMRNVLNDIEISKQPTEGGIHM